MPKATVTALEAHAEKKHLGKKLFFPLAQNGPLGCDYLFKHKWFTYRNLKERDCITLIKNVYLTGNRKNKSRTELPLKGVCAHS